MSDLPLGHITGAAAEERYQLPPKRDLFSTRCINVETGDPAAAMSAIRLAFHNTYELYEKVFECLATRESFVVPPVHRLRHPMIFYYGHTACFYVNKLVTAGLAPRIHPPFEECFAIGVDEMSWDDLNDKHYEWPTVERVAEYRRNVRDAVDALMRSGKFQLQLPLTFANSTANSHNAFWWVMLMGIEHEHIHLETASVHVRELPMKYVHPEMKTFWKPCVERGGSTPANELVTIQGGRVRLGRCPKSPVYGWDVDYSNGETFVDVPTFRASKNIVSNGEFLEFMRDGGYATKDFWDEEGWAWVSWKKPQHPYFWVASNGGYLLRVQVEEIPLPLDWPAEVNHLEATAYCAYLSKKVQKSLRLLNEAEWLLLWDRYVGVDNQDWPLQTPGNISLGQSCSACPVTKNAHGPLNDVVGNVWQHCVNSIYPYEGYRAHPYYDDFSMPTFDGRHTIIKGGTWISTGNEATRDARYAFRRHFFQFVGIRYIEARDDCVSRELCGNVCQTKNQVMDPVANAIVATCYEDALPGGLSNVHRATASLALRSFAAHGERPMGRAFVFACGAGRQAFELTAHFGDVVGSDITARNLIAAFSILERGEASYVKEDEKKVVRSDAYPWAATRGRASFFQADPTNLHSHMVGADLIVAVGVLETTYAPRKVAPHLLTRLNVGGVLVLGSTFAFSTAIAADVGEWITPTHGTPMESLIHELPAHASVCERATIVGPRYDEDGVLRLAAYDTVVIKKVQ